MHPSSKVDFSNKVDGKKDKDSKAASLVTAAIAKSPEDSQSVTAKRELSPVKPLTDKEMEGLHVFSERVQGQYLFALQKLARNVLLDTSLNSTQLVLTALAF